MPHPVAIKIAGFSDVTDNIKYERGAFEKVIKDNNVGNLPVVVLVVSGPYRSGKSFLLNWFVDRLMEIEKKRIKNNVTDVPQNLECFKWASGVDRETSGIMICSKIFKVKPKNYHGKEVAVVLMDTQGVFDEISSEKECKTIFSLGTLISSVQVYNITRMGYDKLNHLDIFLAYGKFFLENYEGKPFQQLQFLIRDWRHSKDYKYGSEGGIKYFNDKWLNKPASGKKDTTKHHREVLKSYFEKVNCYLMPYPGIRLDQDGSLQDVSLDFVNEMNNFVSQTLENLCNKTKTVNGEVVRCKEIPSILEDYVKAYSTEDVPDDKTPVQANAEFYYRKKVDECLKYYNSSFESCSNENKNTPEKLTSLHKKLKKDAQKKFIESKNIDKDIKNKFETQLIDKLGQRLLQLSNNLRKEILEQVNRRYQVECELNNEIKRILDEYDRKMEYKCKHKVDCVELLEKAHSQINFEFKNEFKHICCNTNIDVSCNEFLIDKGVFDDLKQSKSKELDDLFTSKLKHYQNLLNSDQQLHKTSIKTAELDLHDKIEFLFLKYKSEFDEKLNLKTIPSECELKQIYENVKTKILSKFAEHALKYKHKTQSYKFCLSGIDYDDLITKSERELVKNIDVSVEFYKKQIKDKTVKCSKDYLQARLKCDKIVDDVYIKYTRKMTFLSKNIWKFSTLCKFSDYEKNECCKLFNEICENELNNSKLILDLKRLTELKEYYSSCFRNFVQRIDKQFNMYESKLKNELLQYTLVCSDISNFYNNSISSCIDYFSKQYKRYPVEKLKKNAYKISHPDEIENLQHRVLKAHELGTVLKSKTVKKFGEQSYTIKHNFNSFDFSIFDQIKNYEKIVKISFELKLREKLTLQNRKVFLEKLFALFDRQFQWKSFNGDMIEGIIKNHFHDYKFD